MLFDIFSPRVIPTSGIDRSNPNRDYSNISPILGAHSERPRPEYNYVYNSDGLRSIEFSTKPEIVALGCSITLGQGLPQDLRWADLLSKRIDTPIGNISYSGAAINKDISSLFGMMHQYGYKPKTVIANFANFERFYFIDGHGNGFKDWYANHKSKKTRASVPWDYEEILPYELVYYNNLDHIKMLEAFCDLAGVNLIWSTWSNTLTPEHESFLSDNFKHYVKDPTRSLFPDHFETGVNVDNPNKLKPHFEMHDWENVRCHSDYFERYPEIFDHGYDYHKISGKWGPGAHWPHPGVHRQLHWSDFYFEEISKRGWI